MKRERLLWIALGGGAVLAVAAVAVYATLNRTRAHHNVDANGVALSGYDPVSYFPEGGGAPKRGDPRWIAERDGRRYRFSSEANRDAFLADPSRFEPEFGGWCAYAVAHGYKFEVDPESYRVENGRLLLFYRGVFGDARREFEKEGVEKGLHQADTNWPSIADN
jgi:YHS domain-containing protein